MTSDSDPVFKLDVLPREAHVTDPVWLVGKWYFWTETWADAIGPFDTEEKARANLQEYIKQL